MMNSEQFYAVAKLIRMGDTSSRRAAHMVLVDGLQPSAAAAQAGITPQAVSRVVGRINEAMTLVRTAAGVPTNGA